MNASTPHPATGIGGETDHWRLLYAGRGERAAVAFLVRLLPEGAQRDVVLDLARSIEREDSSRPLAHLWAHVAFMLRDGVLLDGLPAARTVELLAELYGVPARTVAAWLEISPKTVARRGDEGRLDPLQSDVALRYGKVFEEARDAFGTEEAARMWLTTPQAVLRGAVPVERLASEMSAYQVEVALELVDYGEYV